jgi:protoporphyrinogen/coproporphyrinogen III oxidase
MARNGAELRVAVVGGGIAGIAAAERLGALGHTVELFEAGPRLGGRIALTPLGEREICLGGKNVGRRYRRFRELIEQRVEPRYEVFGPDTGQLVRGRVRTLSFRSPGMRMRLGARLAARGQVRGGLRFLKLVRQVREDPDAAQLGNPFFAELARMTADPALPDYLGTAICRDAVRHITVRMNGAEPEECHLGNFGSNLGLVVDRFDQPGGNALGEWIGAVEAAHVVHPRSPIAALLVADGAVRGVVGADGAKRHFDRVVLALPAHEAARLIGESEPQLARLLCTIRYFPVGVIVAEYDRPAFPPQFAALAAPPGMVLSNAGSYGLGERHIVRYTFSGAPARESIQPETFDPEALLAVAKGFLGAHAPVAGARRLGFAARSFQPGLCAYRRDHAVFLVEAREFLDKLAGLALAGDYMRGASLEACVRSGQEAAERAITDAGRRTAYPVPRREQVPAGASPAREEERDDQHQPAG